MEKGYEIVRPLIWHLPFQACTHMLPSTATYTPAPQSSIHEMWEQHGGTSQEACEINDFESYEHPGTVFNRAALVVKIDLRLLPGGSREESTASQSVLMH